MTPSEKKAREILPDCYKDSRLLRSRISSALDAAERRGFERAKRMACKKAEDFDAYKRPCLNKSHDSRFCGYCRYEEEAK